jgi:hypothetical protein
MRIVAKIVMAEEQRKQLEIWTDARKVPRFFRDLAETKLQRGIFRNVPELLWTIEHYIAEHNRNPKPSSGPPKPLTYLI